jgi:hypothetical protein
MHRLVMTSDELVIYSPLNFKYTKETKDDITYIYITVFELFTIFVILYTELYSNINRKTIVVSTGKIYCNTLQSLIIYPLVGCC